MIPVNFWEQLSETERNLMRKNVKSFQKADKGKVHAHAKRKKSIADFEAYKKAHSEFRNQTPGKRLKLPKISVEGIPCKAGKYIAAAKLGEQMVYVRTDERHNRKGDLSGDVIVYDPESKGFKFATAEQLKDKNVKAKIEKEKLGPLKERIRKDIVHLHDNITLYAENKEV